MNTNELFTCIKIVVLTQAADKGVICCSFVQVGVHIADVTHFMKPGTALDEEACNRCTTVYLSDKVSLKTL